MRHFVFLMAVVASLTAHAQDLGRVALVQALKDAACPLRLMCIAAHPDDEDGATLAYYRMKYGVKTFVVIATRGEGGQNEIGPELYGELGAIRTREMQNAANVEGSELHFLNFPEFGFSKSPEEALEKWDHDAALARVKALLTELEPQVVITHHGLMKDHGHHQAIGALIKEAVEDPAMGVQRLYVRRFEGGDDIVAQMDLGELEPVRGVTYAQVAAHALEEHKSQGMKLFIDRYLSGRPQAQYMSRVRNSASGSVVGDEFGPLFKGVSISPEAVRPALQELAQRAEDGASNVELLAAMGSDELARAAGIAAEIRVTARVNDTTVVRGQALQFTIDATDFGAAEVQSATIAIEGLRGGFEGVKFEQALGFVDGVSHAQAQVTVPERAVFTVPNAEHFNDDGLFVPQLRVRAWGKLKGGQAFSAQQEVYVDVAPAVTVGFEAAPYLINAHATEVPVRLHLTNHMPGAATAEIALAAGDGIALATTSLRATFGTEDQQQTLGTVARAKRGFSGGATLAATLANGGHRAESSVLVDAVHLPKKARIGIVRSYDDTLANTLRKLGVEHDLIGADDFAADTLRVFSAILIDMRAYAYLPDLVANNEAIFDYVRAGGTVITMYHKTFDWKPAYAPIPFSVANNRVTREDAAMTLLAPQHAIFNMPNKIQPGDWDGWIQERGLYFAGEWPKEYTPLIECHDPGESIPPGALIAADYGKGHYVYCALVLYRQLRELNPGALKLFANLIGY